VMQAGRVVLDGDTASVLDKLRRGEKAASAVQQSRTGS